MFIVIVYNHVSVPSMYTHIKMLTFRTYTCFKLHRSIDSEVIEPLRDTL